MHILGRVWIPVLVAVAVLVGGSAVYRLHGIFGTQTGGPPPDARSQTPPYPPKSATYEVTGPAGTVGVVSYVDENAQPKQAAFTALPWVRTITARTPAIFAYLVAQGNSDEIGCRITVNGQVKDQDSSHQINAETSCLLTSG